MPDHDSDDYRCPHALHLLVDYNLGTHTDIDLELPLPDMLSVVDAALRALAEVRRDVIRAGALRN